MSTSPINLRYVLAELGRTLRNTRYLVFAIGMPLLLFFAISTTDDGGTLDGLHRSAYTMVSMATFGMMEAPGAADRLDPADAPHLPHRPAVRRRQGRHRVRRGTALPGRGLRRSRGTKGVHLSVAGWLATGAAILLALLPISALGIWLGYRARIEDLPAVSGGILSLLALLGGVWVPLEPSPGCSPTGPSRSWTTA